MTGLTRLMLALLISCTFNLPAAAEMPATSTAAATSSTLSTASVSTSAEAPAEKIAPYVPRFGRSRPVVVVVGENNGTVLVDFVIPYAVLAQSGVADVVSLATQAGPLKLAPLQITPDRTVAQFDVGYPDGADYVFVPAVVKNHDPSLIAWVTSQAVKGATLVSICNGSLVLANAGLTRGHRATGHWSTHESRVKSYPDTHWLKNTRYVADGKIVSSAGISAALPTSLALVEAIAGTVRAETLARQLGVSYWGTKHDSDVFHLRLSDYITAFSNSLLHASEDIGVSLTPGVDEIALALSAEAYADTLRANVLGVAPSEAPVRTRNGLLFIPDRVAGQGKPLDLLLPQSDTTPSAQMQDQLIDDIGRRYGASTARFVVLDWEYATHER